jgi:hypothetical protein
VNHNKHATPLLDAVKRMHVADDAAATGYCPYNGRASRPLPVPGEFPDTAKHEADQILACYDSYLTLENDK